MTMVEAAIWHDVECAAYAADLPIWDALAQAIQGPILELGCGNGRVSLHLAHNGHEVVGLDSHPGLVAALNERAEAEGLPARAETGDAGDFELHRRFGLILAPMQLIQLLSGPAARSSCLRAIAAHLAPGGRVALAIVEGSATGSPPSPPLPDVQEHDGWVYSSLPLGVAAHDGDLIVERLRQTVSPGGELREERNSVRLAVLAAGELEAEARSCGLRPGGRRSIEATDSHVGSTVVVLEA